MDAPNSAIEPNLPSPPVSDKEQMQVVPRSEPQANHAPIAKIGLIIIIAAVLIGAVAMFWPHSPSPVKEVDNFQPSDTAIPTLEAEIKPPTPTLSLPTPTPDTPTPTIKKVPTNTPVPKKVTFSDLGDVDLGGGFTIRLLGAGFESSNLKLTLLIKNAYTSQLGINTESMQISGTGVMSRIKSAPEEVALDPGKSRTVYVLFPVLPVSTVTVYYADRATHTLHKIGTLYY